MVDMIINNAIFASKKFMIISFNLDCKYHKEMRISFNPLYHALRGYAMAI